MGLTRALHLTTNEAKVLDIFLEKGTLTTGDITRYTGISRPNCYDLLNKLIEKGLITKLTRNGLVQYSANRIDYQTLLQEKKKELHALKNEIDTYNKRITATDKVQADPHHVEVYSGVKGLQKILPQVLNSKKISVFGAEGALEQKYPHIWNVWVRKIKEKGITFQVIYNEQSRKLRKKKPLPVMTQRYIEGELLTNVTTQITDTTVNIYHWHKIPLVVSIRNKDIAKAYREEFRRMWEKANP